MEERDNPFYPASDQQEWRVRIHNWHQQNLITEDYTFIYEQEARDFLDKNKHIVWAIKMFDPSRTAVYDSTGLYKPDDRTN